MPDFTTVRRVPHSTEKMFAIVADVERYPEFLPMCDNLIITDTKDQNGTKILEADMTIGFGGFKETFKSEVTIDEAKGTITTKAISGPFDHMQNSWRFKKIDTGGDRDASDVHFAIDYKFKSKTLEMLMGGMFDKAFRKYADSFEERANSI